MYFPVNKGKKERIEKKGKAESVRAVAVLHYISN